MLKRRRRLVLGCQGSVWMAICHEIEEPSRIELWMLLLSCACNHICTHPYNSMSPCSQKSSSRNSSFARRPGSYRWIFLAFLSCTKGHLKDEFVVDYLIMRKLQLTVLAIELCAGIDAIHIILALITATCSRRRDQKKQENSTLTSKIHYYFSYKNLVGSWGEDGFVYKRSCYPSA